MEEIIIKENENYSLTAATNNKLVLLEKQRAFNNLYCSHNKRKF